MSNFSFLYTLSENDHFILSYVRNLIKFIEYNKRTYTEILSNLNVPKRLKKLNLSPPLFSISHSESKKENLIKKKKSLTIKEKQEYLFLLISHLARNNTINFISSSEFRDLIQEHYKNNISDNRIFKKLLLFLTTFYPKNFNIKYPGKKSSPFDPESNFTISIISNTRFDLSIICDHIKEDYLSYLESIKSKNK